MVMNSIAFAVQWSIPKKINLRQLSINHSLVFNGFLRDGFISTYFIVTSFTVSRSQLQIVDLMLM